MTALNIKRDCHRIVGKLSKGKEKTNAEDDDVDDAAPTYPEVIHEHFSPQKDFNARLVNQGFVEYTEFSFNREDLLGDGQ